MTMKLEIYQGAEGEVFFDVDEMNQTIWAEQGKIAELFEVDRTVISRHLRNIFADEELEAGKCVKEEVEERLEGGRRIARKIKKYNLLNRNLNFYIFYLKLFLRVNHFFHNIYLKIH